MKWNKPQYLFFIALFVLTISLTVFNHFSDMNESLLNELRVIVNPSYDGVLRNDLDDVQFEYVLESVGNISTSTIYSLTEMNQIEEKDNTYQIILPVFKDNNMSQIVTFNVPKHHIKRDFPTTTMLIILIQLICISILFIGIKKEKTVYSKLIEGLRSISVGKFVPVEGEDELISNYNAVVHELKIAKETQSRSALEHNIFLSAVSHELKTPLATIVAYLEAFEHGMVTSDEKREAYLEIIKSKFSHLSIQIEDFFKYAQNQSGQFKYNFQEVYFDVYMNKWCSGLIDKINYKNMLPKCLVNIDVIRIEQILENLFNNARKHASKTIDVLAYREDDYVVVDVKDDGNGISPKDLPHIFDYYYQGDESKKKDYEGVGMGLALCKQIIDAHKGKILVKSSIGAGTTFTIKIPVC